MTFAKQITVVRPRDGKPYIHHDESATQDVHAALAKHGWENVDRIASDLRKRGYQVEVRVKEVR